MVESIPTFALVKSSLKSPGVNRILKRTSAALIRERIHHKRRLLDVNAKSLLALHLRLASLLSPQDWEYIDGITFAMGEVLHRNVTEKQKSKFIRLSNSKPSVAPLDRNRVVVNLTSECFDEPTFSVLSRGLNFTPTPRSIPFVKFIDGVEQAVRKLPIHIFKLPASVAAG